MEAAQSLAGKVGVLPACRALGVPRASYYRRLRPVHGPLQRRTPPLKLAPEEVAEVLEVLHSPRFMDRSPRQIWATLLDEEQRYLCSVRTMYRILDSQGELRERRNQRRHPKYKKPVLLATRPNEVWSWDISKLKGPTKGVWYHLYLVLDIFSRYVVGWLIAQQETAGLAKDLIRASFKKQGVTQDQLTIHADRGPSMTSKSLALLMSDLGVTRSHNRPYTSNDNPFSEAHFKTVKYHPSFPERFGSVEDARAFFRQFFRWYNTEHRHSQLALLPPADVHYARSDAILERRARTLEGAFTRHPKRFKHRQPQPGAVPEKVWINPPKLPEANDKPVPETPGPEPGNEAEQGLEISARRIDRDELLPAESTPQSPSCLLSVLGWDERRSLYPEPAGGLRVDERSTDLDSLDLRTN